MVRPPFARDGRFARDASHGERRESFRDGRSALDDAEHVLFAQDEMLLAIDLDLGA